MALTDKNCCHSDTEDSGEDDVVLWMFHACRMREVAHFYSLYQKLLSPVCEPTSFVLSIPSEAHSTINDKWTAMELISWKQSEINSNTVQVLNS